MGTIWKPLAHAVLVHRNVHSVIAQLRVPRVQMHIPGAQHVNIHVTTVQSAVNPMAVHLAAMVDFIENTTTTYEDISV